jgi:uncharacterized membrane protein
MQIEVSLIPGLMIGFSVSSGYVEIALGIVYILVEWSDDGTR